MAGSRGRPRGGETGPTQEPGGHGTPPPFRQRPPGPHRDDEPFDVHIEFVALDGEAGRELRKHQAAIMRRVLQWISGHRDEQPGNVNDRGSDRPEPR